VSTKSSNLTKQCLACGLCIDRCPILSSFTSTPDSPKLVADIIDMLDGGPSTSVTKEIVWTCMACGQCRQWCPESIAPDIFSAARRELIRRGSAPVEKLSFWLPDFPYRFSSLFSILTLAGTTMPWHSTPAPQGFTIDIVLYLGCYVLAIPAIAITMTKLIEKMGFSVVAIGGGGLCCGAGYALNGKYNAAQQAAQRSVEVIKSFKPKAVVFECASCYGALNQRLGSASKCYLHTDFLLENLKRLPLRELPGYNVTYHDTCDPRRSGIGNYEVPRQLLKSLPGISLVEMEHHSENSLCCGGLANTTNPTATRKLRMKRLEGAVNTGARIMVTSCRSCYGAFVGLAPGYLQVTHDVLLVGESAGITVPELFREIIQSRNLSKIKDDASTAFAAHGFDVDTAAGYLIKYLQLYRTSPA